MIKKKSIIIVALFICIILSFSYPVVMKNLIVDEEPVQSDIIIVTEGHQYVRAYKAAELLYDNFSKSGKMIISPIDEINIQDYKTFGVKQEQIIPETEATSTYENAVITLKMMKEQGYSSAIIVSSDYHMLRMKMVFERVNKEYGYNLTYVAAYHLMNGEFVPWYEAGDFVGEIARGEFWKYWGYLLGLYHFFNL